MNVTTRWRSVSVVVVLGLLVACSGDKKDGGAPAPSGEPSAAASSPGSCDQRAMAAPMKTCLDYVGSAWREKEVRARCAGEGQTFVAACPKEGVVVSCKVQAGAPMEAVQHFYDKADKATAACKSLGGELL